MKRNWLWLCVLMSCDASRVRGVTEGDALLSTQRLVFPATRLGESSAQEFEVTHTGATVRKLPLIVSAPFLFESEQVELVAGETKTLRISFAPTELGSQEAVALIGDLRVELQGEGVEALACFPQNACHSAEKQNGACVQTPKAEGTNCSGVCLLDAQCSADGRCVGLPKNCEDNNPCTVDACSEASGCVHVPKVCSTEGNPCLVARCDAQLGCVTEFVEDGTLCGEDDCARSTLDVCMAGKCVVRKKPSSTPICTHWTQANAPEYVEPWVQYGFAMTYDKAEQKVVLFGGARNDSEQEVFTNALWGWDGKKWELLSPHSETTGPSPRKDAAIAFDSTRNELVVVGGVANNRAVLNDTWVWKQGAWVRKTGVVPNVLPIGYVLPFRSADMVEVGNSLVWAYGDDGYEGNADYESFIWDGFSWSSYWLNPSNSYRFEDLNLFEKNGTVFSVSKEAYDYHCAGSCPVIDPRLKSLQIFQANVELPIETHARRRGGLAASWYPKMNAALIVWGDEFSGLPTTYVFRPNPPTGSVSFEPLSLTFEPACNRDEEGSCDMAFDELRNRMVLFGGSRTLLIPAIARFGEMARTWTYVAP